MHRVRSEDSKGKAVWRPGQAPRGCATVERVRGKYMSTMGYSNLLFPEEAVFLADREEIDLYIKENDETPERRMVGVEVFALLEEGGVDLKAYSAYAVLREQRFHTFRSGFWKVLGNKEALAALPVPASYTWTDAVDLGQQQASEEAGERDAKRVRMTATNPPELRVSYDVYKPQSGFSKNKMGKPNFHLAIIGAEGYMPPVSTLHKLVASPSEETAKTRLCLVADSSLTFVELTEFDPFAEQAKKDVDLKKV